MQKGLVIKSIGSSYNVKSEDGNVTSCTIRGKLRLKGIKTTNPVTVGDIVSFELNDTDDTGVIVKIDERKNYIIRRSTNLSKRHHIIAANIDRAFLITTLVLPETSTIFIDRFLATAEAYRIPVSIVFNKTDLYNEPLLEYLEQLISVYSSIGYECIKTSAVKNINVDLVKERMKGNINLLAGHSGVGKSTLVNKIDPNLDLRISEISMHSLKGVHTTTFSEMFSLQTGGYIIDTPGIKGFGLTDIDREEIYHFFREIFEVAKDCKYHNCLHLSEPECAVREAVEKGVIAESRYASYYNMLFSDDLKYR